MVAACFTLATQAQTKWDMPTPYSDGEFHTVDVKLFAAEVRQVTNSQLDITVHTNGSLIKHPDMLSAVSMGQVNMVELLLGQFGNEAPVFAADNVLFVATGYDAGAGHEGQGQQLCGTGLAAVFLHDGVGDRAHYRVSGHRDVVAGSVDP